MKHVTVVGASTLAIGIAAGASLAQQQPQGPQPFFVGNRLGLPINPAADGDVRRDLVEREGVRRHLLSRELFLRSRRGLIVVPNRGVAQNVQTNNAWVSFINHDGSVHTARWIGVQNPGDQRTNLTPPLVLNEPLGSDIANGMLYVADRDGGTSPTDPSVSVDPPVQHADRRAGR